MNLMQTELTTVGAVMAAVFLIAGCVSVAVLIRLQTIRVRAITSSREVPGFTPITVAILATIAFVVAALVALNVGRGVTAAPA